MVKESFTSVISDVPNVTNAEERARLRARLRQQYEDCQARLQALVKARRENLSNTVQLCSSMMRTLSETKQRCDNLKKRITNCMELLQFNRSQFRTMWLESLEHRYAHKILGEIEDLLKTPSEVKASLVDNKLDHATDVIVVSLQLLDGNLCNAEALKELRSELQQLENKLYQMILAELRKQLYVCDFTSENFKNVVADTTYDEIFKNGVSAKSSSFKESLQGIEFDATYTTLLLKCLAKMKKLPEAIDYLKGNCQKELQMICNSLSLFMLDVIRKSIETSVFDLPADQQQGFLLDLLENMICVYRKISCHYKEFLSILQQVFEENGISDLTFTLEEIYSKIQASLEYFVGCYLDMQPTVTSSPTNSFSFSTTTTTNVVASYFLPKNAFENKESYLFKFGNSCLALSTKQISQNLKNSPGESENGIDKDGKVALVCKPAIKNTTLIFNVLKIFVTEMQESMQLSIGEHCPLRSFLYDCANLYLNHVNSDINKMLENAGVNLDAWNVSIISDNCSCRVNPEKHVLTCNSILLGVLREIQNLMISLPDYTNHFLHLIYYVALDYKDMFQKAFKSMFDQEQNILSISWARDRDIRRLMKSFLNWRNLEDDKSVDVMESPEEIRLRNKEESELLIRNLRSEADMSWDTIKDLKHITNLALLQENLLWFAVELLKFVKNVAESVPIAASDSVHLPCSGDERDVSSAFTGMRKVIKDYEDFADMCLLSLHLEARARCFRYLLPFSIFDVYIDGGFLKDFDAAVKDLTTELLQLDEVLLPILTPKELKYVFEGLDELVASLIILVVSNMSRMNDSVVLRFDRAIHIIQCTLANITTSREASLERARHFIALLKLSHQDILDRIVEEGPSFSESEYASVFKLISSKSDTLPQDPAYYLDKLKTCFSRLAVANADKADAQ